MNIIELLEEIGLKYSSRGKNIAPGWIGMQCPFCDDRSNHFGIRMKDLRCSCWRCGGHSIVKLISEISNCSNKEARRIAKNLSGAEDFVLSEQGFDREGLAKHSTQIPTEAKEQFPRIHKNYLRNRNFHANRLIRKYDLLACHNIGEYKFRIIIPIFMNRHLVSFTSRAIFDEMTPPYKNAKIRESIMSPKDTIYSYDTLIKGKDCLLVEGPVDAWRFGEGACATIGLQFTQTQLSWLRQKEIRNLYIMLDSERFAQRVKAEEIARLMAPWVNSFEIIEAKWKKDVGEFSPREAEHLRKLLNFND